MEDISTLVEQLLELQKTNTILESKLKELEAINKELRKQTEPVINPETGRPIHRGGRVYKRLLCEGKIKISE